MATETKKRLALAIIDFLSTSLKDGTLSPGDQESIEIAQSCIAESFKVDPTDQAAMRDAVGGQNLLGIYGVYEKMRNKGSNDVSSKTGGGPTEEQKKQAESFKSQGNAAMAKKDYSTAIEAYSKALELVPQNPIYLSNRAAAYSASHQHAKASADAELAVEADPSYTKAWSRLGLARYALGDSKGSMEAYQKGIEHEGNGGSDAMKKGYETAKKKVEEQEENRYDDDEAARETGAARGGAAGGGMPDLSNLASMLGGGRGGGGGGPDLASMMNNPMFASMAQKLMSNPQLMGNLMSNPQLRQMAENFGGGGGAGRGGGGGGGMPDLSALMSDPNIAELAKQFGAGGGRGGGSSGGGAGSGSGIV